MDNLNGTQHLFDEATNYVKLGLPIVPAEGKAVKIERWTTLPAEEFLSAEYFSFWKRATGIGVLCGERSGIICIDIDLDKEKDKELVAEITSKLPPILSGKTGNPNRRASQFFRFNGEIGRKYNAIGVEVLSTGQQTIIPPSKHPNFDLYQWVGTPLNQLDLDDLPTLPEGFIEWLEQKNEEIKNGGKTSTDKDLRKGDGRCKHNSHNVISALAFALFKQNYPFDRLVKAVIDKDKKINHDSDYYYFECPSRPWRKKTIEENAADFIEEFYKRHGPNYAPEFEPVGQTGADKQSEKPKDGIKLLSLGDLLKMPDEKTQYVVENLLPSGGTSIVAAKPKCGKTTLLRQLSLSVARGEMFLNRGTSKGSVVYLSVEEKREEIKNHFKDLGATGDEEIYIFAERAPKDTIAQLKPIVEEIKPSLIILDTLFKIVRVRDANDYATISAALEPIQDLARTSGAHILCVHHAGKADREDADGILGSTAIFGAFDTAIIMSRQKNNRTIKSIQRYGTDLEESVLHFDKITRSSRIGEEKWRAKVDERNGEVLDYMRQVGEKVTFADIKSGTGMDLKILRETLKFLIDKKIISVTGRGTKGNPHLYTVGMY